MSDNNSQPETNTNQQFAIQRFFVKDLSFEAPKSPAIFADEWKPEMHLNIETESKRLDEGVYEVVLHLTVTVNSKEAVAFLAEVKQGGIFSITGFPEEDLSHTLGSFCPSILYPYARHVVTDLVIWGGFPQLILGPVNFDALYARQLEEQKNQA